MPESYGITALQSGGSVKQLIARHTPLATRGILLTGGVPYLRGCLVHAATVAGPFIKSTTGTLPADTDVMAIVSQDIDLTALGNTVHLGYVGPGEFVRGTVLGASAALDAAAILAVDEALVKRGMNLVRAAYDDVTDAM